MFTLKSRFHLVALFLVGFFAVTGVTARASTALIATGQTVALSVTVDGTAPFSYQWYKNGAVVIGVTSATYQIASFQATNAGNYSAVISNSSGSTTSDNATLALATAPLITAQPFSQTVTAGATATFTVAASGTPTPVYQWRKDGTSIGGATGASYMIASTAGGDAGTYTVVATNSAGSVTSAGAALTVNSTPVITMQPASQNVIAGSSVTFSMAGNGSPSPTYQWRKNGVNVSGATSTSYTIAGVTATSAGTYTVVAINSAGAATSNGAVLTVNDPIAMPAPGNLTARGGSGAITLAWSDNATNEAGFEVQYSVDGTNFLAAGTVGANVLSYTDTGLPDTTTYTYRVRAYLGTTVSGFSNTASATTPAATINWTQADVGSVGLAGSGSVGATTATVSGSGADIWGTADAFRFVYQPWRGDGVMIARVASLDNSDAWAKAGIMFRESLAANARNAFVCVTALEGVQFQNRTSTGGSTTQVKGPGALAPYWLKLVRAGNTFTSYASANGSTWTVIGTQTMTMGTDIYVGFAVTSHNNAMRTIAVFEQMNLGTGSQPVTVDAPGNLTATASSGAIALAWSDNAGNEAGFEVQYSMDGTNFLTAGTVGANVLSYTDTGLPDSTTYMYRVRAYLGTTVSSFSNSVSATTPAATVNWLQADVGSVGLAGSGSVGATTATVSGSGADIWGAADAFRFVYQPWRGDGVMITRVASLDNTDLWAKAGVMFRESLAANARNAFVFVTPLQSVYSQNRTSTGGSTTQVKGPGALAPYWLKMVRAGNTFTSYASTNGSTWTLVGAQTISMGTDIYVGFAVTSHTNAARAIAVFDEMNLGASSLPVSVAAPGNLRVTASSGTIALAWSDNATNEAGFEVQYSVDGTNFLAAGTVGANVLSYTDTGLPDSTTYTYRVRAYLGTTVSSFSNTASATTPAATVNWTQADVGSVGLAGSGSVGATTATVSGSGADIWGTADAFRFVYQPWRGDGVMIARLASLDNSDAWAKAGIMFRESLAANARNSFVCVTPLQSVYSQNRTSTGGSTTQVKGPGALAPYWLKLVRAGNTFTSYASANGSNWTLIGTQTMTMGTDIYVGFAVTSHNNAVRTIAVFDFIPITAQ